MNNILIVTGGAGFIGSCFVRRWLTHNNSPLVNLDKLTYAGNLQSLTSVANHPLYTFVQGDIGDFKLVRNLLAEHQPRAVINFAAESNVDRSIDQPADFLETNVVGTFRLLETVHDYWKVLSDSSKKDFRFVQISTDEVYGSLPPQGQFCESSRYQPNSPYSASKAAGDHFVRSYHRTFGLPTIITHCSNNYGAYQFPEKLIPLMILNALQASPLPVYGDGKHIRDWLYVEDHCRALECILDHGSVGESYNIGGDCEVANVDLVEMICDMVDQLCPRLPHSPCRTLIHHVLDRPGHDRRYSVDASKVRHLGWQPKMDLATGLQHTVKWYVNNEAWWKNVAKGKYQFERLGNPR